MDRDGSWLNQLIAERIHPIYTKQFTNSRTKAKPIVEPDNSARPRAYVTPGRACIAREREQGGRGSSRVASSVYIYIYSPLKKLLTQGASTPVPIPGQHLYKP